MSRYNTSNLEPGTAADHDQRIFEMTGIMPDPRTHIPQEEIREMIAGFQAGDPEAAEQLVATRLNWIYSTYAQKESIKARPDLSIEDIMGIGGLATLEVASRLDPEDPDASKMLLVKIPNIMGDIVMQSKLVHTISPAGHKLIDARYSEHDERMVEKVVLAGDSAAVAAVASRDRTIAGESPDQAVAAAEKPEVIRSSMDVLDDVERYIVEAKFGIGDFAGQEDSLSFTSIGNDLGLNRETARRAYIKALEKLGTAYGTLTEGPQPYWTRRQRAPQEKWLQEIKSKRETKSEEETRIRRLTSVAA